LERRLDDDLRLSLRYRPPWDVEALCVRRRVRSRLGLGLVLYLGLRLELRLVYLRSGLCGYGSIARVLLLWYGGLLLLRLRVMLRTVVGLSIPAILLCGVGTRKCVMASLLSLFLKLLLSVLLSVMPVYKVSACDNLKAAEDHGVV